MAHLETEVAGLAKESVQYIKESMMKVCDVTLCVLCGGSMTVMM